MFSAENFLSSLDPHNTSGWSAPSDTGTVQNHLFVFLTLWAVFVDAVLCFSEIGWTFGSVVFWLSHNLRIYGIVIYSVVVQVSDRGGDV